MNSNMRNSSEIYLLSYNQAPGPGQTQLFLILAGSYDQRRVLPALAGSSLLAILSGPRPVLMTGNGFLNLIHQYFHLVQQVAEKLQG